MSGELKLNTRKNIHKKHLMLGFRCFLWWSIVNVVRTAIRAETGVGVSYALD